MKKNIILVLFLILIIFVVSGCKADEKESSLDFSVEVEYNTVEKIVHNDNNDEIMNITITYPAIKNENNIEALEKINDYYIEFAQNYILNIENEEKAFAQEDFESARADKREFIPHEYANDVELKYNGKLVSFLNIQYMNTGGAHPNSIQVADTFDLATGEKLTLEEVMGKNQDDVKNIVLEKVISEIEKVEGTDEFYYYETYKDDIKTTFKPEDYFITNEGLCIFYQQYSIAPYVAGFPTFMISNDELGETYILNK